MVYRSPVQYIRFQGPSYPPGTWGSRDRGEGTHTGRHLGRHLGRHTRVDEPHNQTDSPTRARARAHNHATTPPGGRHKRGHVGHRLSKSNCDLLTTAMVPQRLTGLFRCFPADSTVHWNHTGHWSARWPEKRASCLTTRPEHARPLVSCARGFLVCATARLYVIGPLTLQCIFCGVSRPCTIHLRYTRIHSGYRILRDTVAGCIKIHQDTPSRRNSTTSFTRKPHRSRINACTPTTRPSSK